MAPLCASISLSPRGEKEEDGFEGLTQPKSQDVPLSPSPPPLNIHSGNRCECDLPLKILPPELPLGKTVL